MKKLMLLFIVLANLLYVSNGYAQELPDDDVDCDKIVSGGGDPIKDDPDVETGSDIDR